MANEPMYGERDTKVRLWVDGKFFYSLVPRLAAERAERAQEYHHSAADWRALCCLAHIATEHRDNPRGKGEKVTADELGVEVVPMVGAKGTPEHENNQPPPEEPVFFHQ